MGYAAAAPAYSPNMYPAANPTFQTGMYVETLQKTNNMENAGTKDIRNYR